MGGIPGQFFKQFGLTVAAAVLVSLLVARLITPMMAAYVLRGHGEAPSGPGLVMRFYARFLRTTLRRPYITLAVGLGAFALSIWSTTLLPTGFLPPQDDSRTVLSIELPPGSTLEQTAARTDAIARAFRTLPEVRSVLTIGGTTPTGAGPEVRRAAMVVALVPKDERDRSQKQVEGALTGLLASMPDVRGWYVNERGERELSLSVLGDDPAALDRGVARLSGAMRRLPGFSNVAESAGVARPEIRIVPRLDEATRFGVSTQAISEAARIATIGDIDANLAKLHVGDRLVPIRVRANPALRRDLGALGTLPVTGAGGQAVPLAAVADIEVGQGPSSIERYDRVRRVVLGADLRDGVALGAALAAVNALPEAKHLPPGVRIANSGDTEIMAEVFSGFAMAMGTGLMLVLALLVLLFGNVFQPLTILLSLPLCLGGVILALLLTHEPISLPVAIGILMLMGIVTKNAIMLVDFALERRRQGLSPREAILDAGAKRAQPIVMTTIAMVAGMVPSALGLGDGGEFRSPMAVGVIGGLLVSTVLSLVFVPSFYLVMDDLSRVAGRLAGRVVSPEKAAAVPRPGRRPGTRLATPAE